MYYQTDPYFGTYMNKYACLFMDIAYARELFTEFRWTKEELKKRWIEAIGNGTGIGESIITGDLNHDGDMHDKGELIIQNHSALAELLNSPIRLIPPSGPKLVNGHFPPTQPILRNEYAIGCFFNPRTQFRHFATVNSKKIVTYDSIEGGSVTVREGYLESLRIYEVLV